MSDQIVGSVVTVIVAIIGVAIIAALVSKNANTSGVLSAGGSAFSGILKSALAPISGSAFSASVPSYGGGF